MENIIERNSSIELLRILLMGGVIVLHYNYGRALEYVTPGTFNQIVLYILESIFVCSVNEFILISGYFSATKKSTSLFKLGMLLVEVIIVRLGYTIANGLLENTLSVKHVIISFLPINYYVILYVSLSLLSPFINKLIDNLNMSTYKNLLILGMVLLSVNPFMLDTVNYITGKSLNDINTLSRFGSGYGYTLANFILMYLIGGYLRKFNPRIKFVCLKFPACICILTLMGLIGKNRMYDLNFAYSYCNPIVILETVYLFVLISKIKVKQLSKAINIIASGSFMVFLTHGYFLNSLHIKEAVSSNTLVMLLHIICVVAVLIILGGGTLGIAFNFVIARIQRKLPKKIVSARLSLESEPELPVESSTQ